MGHGRTVKTPLLLADVWPGSSLFLNSISRFTSGMSHFKSHLICLNAFYILLRNYLLAAAVRSKAMVLLSILFIVAHIFCLCGFVYGMCFRAVLMSFLVLQLPRWRRERVGYFDCLLISYNC